MHPALFLLLLCPATPHRRRALLPVALLVWLLRAVPALGQQAPARPVPPSPDFSLEQCLQYALSNQPLIRQARLDEQTNEADIRIGLAGWLPQVNLTGNAQHYFQLPFTVFPNEQGQQVPRQIGLRNTSTFSLAGTQALYNNEVWLALRSARPSRVLYRQITQTAQTNVVADVSKAFFDVLLSQRQLGVYQADITRLQRALKDARARYDAGVSDKIDFKQAEISLNTSLAARKQVAESIKAKTAFLKQLMGLPNEQALQLRYDTLRLEQDALADTTLGVNPTNRLEYQQLQTEKALQAAQIGYYRWAFLPALSAYGNYNTVFQNNEFSRLYSRRFPSSFAGVQLALPVFTGTRRLQNLRRARLLDERLDEDLVATRNLITTEYEQALATYKGYFADYQLGKRNLALSQEVYDVVNLQYREGIKPYLDVLVAQTTLRTAQLNYYVALFQVLSSKVDLQRARGELPINY
ncbi:TolC family protein [Hymenobacter oligotrophus]|uniref:TolC family protein n=1 Tax=Hymenobacter oligotrophus TaxID=2319843 RepID=A0A3B7R944_9BACT|nr:TolC family protein [Hymenobacter oligotrophus]AYA37359.1 TolC family protein [Hymenobacter oligotrophus]